MVKQHNQNGFTALLVLGAILLIAGVGFGAWYVMHQNSKDDSKKSTSNTSQQDTTDDADDETAKPDPYAGWQTHDNTTYGVSFKYPTDWQTDEVASSTNTGDDSTVYVIKQEYGINLKRNEEVKYNNTASVEIFDQSISSAATWYDNYFAQSASNHVVKTNHQLKGKESVQYAVTNHDVEMKIYLFTVGSKTYNFSSVNEELNVQIDADYWTKFKKVFDSLQID